MNDETRPWKFDPSNWQSQPLTFTEQGLEVGHFQVMQYWEAPIMQQLAAFATRRRGRVLEVGFGLGISADFAISLGCTEYVIVEAHPLIAATAREWAARQTTTVTVVDGFWQDRIHQLGAFDGIIFDTFPLHEGEQSKNHFPFIPVARTLLSPGGFFTYYSDETRDFRSEHLRLIFENFNCVELACVDNLVVPPSCRYWKDDHMVIPCLSRPRI
jgi:spermidine synthase